MHTKESNPVAGAKNGKDKNRDHRSGDEHPVLWRAEFVDDFQGQRTGTKTRSIEAGFGRQHWFSPQIEIRPEVS